MRILLLKSLLLCTNCPSFLPILCGILFVLVVDLFLPWNPFCFCRGILFVFTVDTFCFCRGFVFAVVLFLPWTLFVFVVDTFVYIPSFFLFLSFLPCSFNFLPRNPKNVGVFLEKVHRFLEKVHRFFVFLGDVAKL